MSVYLRFSFNILVRIYPVKTPFSQNFPAARADRPCAYFFEIFTFRKSRCAFISFQKSPESGSVRLLKGGAVNYISLVIENILVWNSGFVIEKNSIVTLKMEMNL